MQHSARVQTHVADVTNFERTQAALDDSIERTGPIDVLICNAGMSIPKLLVDMPLSDARSTMEVRSLAKLRAGSLELCPL